MLTLRRNQRTVWYCNPIHPEQGQTDSDGYLVGDRQPTYGEAVALLAYVAPPTGRAVATMFGIDLQYDRVLIPAEHPCPIKEGAALFVEKEPEYDEDGHPLPDYIALRVSESLNFSHVAIKKVDVTL